MQEEAIYEMRLTADEVLGLARGNTLRTEAVVEAAQGGLPIVGAEEDWLGARGIATHVIELTESEVAELADADFERINAVAQDAQDIAEKEGLGSFR